jgi:RNA polymerase sigma-70 factor (ECF subfamily)
MRAMATDAGQLPDEELLAGLAGGDSRFVEVFVRRFQRLVLGVATTIAGDQATAEDVTVRVFEQARGHARMYGPPPGPARTWLRAIARDQTVDAIQARAANPVKGDELKQLLTTMAHTPAGLTHEGPAGLRAKLGRLPANQARAVTMASIYGMTARQIANAEGVPLSATRMRITAGMQTLRGHPLR